MLLSGAEEELINFLKDGDEIIKEGILHVLAKAGGTIREQLAVSTRCVLWYYFIMNHSLVHVLMYCCLLAVP